MWENATVNATYRLLTEPTVQIFTIEQTLLNFIVLFGIAAFFILIAEAKGKATFKLLSSFMCVIIATYLVQAQLFGTVNEVVVLIFIVLGFYYAAQLIPLVTSLRKRWRW